MEQHQSVAQLVADVLGSTVVGVYLHGSAVQAGLRPASDLDVLVVAEHPLTEGQRRQLVNGLLPMSGLTAAVRPVELLVVTRAEITPWRYPPMVDFLYGEWLRAEFEAGELPRPTPMPDLALLLSTVRAAGRTLSGPLPSYVLPVVPQEDVLRASAAAVPALLAELEDDTRNVVLTLARVWTTLATGEIRSKDAAADWALARLPEEQRPILVHARHLYLENSYAEERWDEGLRARARAFAERVVAEIDALHP